MAKLQDLEGQEIDDMLGLRLWLVNEQYIKGTTYNCFITCIFLIPILW